MTASSSLKEIAERYAGQPFPVLENTRRQLAAPGADDLSMEAVGRLIALDPGLAANVLRSANTGRQSHFTHRLTTIEYTVRMLGTSKIREIGLKAPVMEQCADPAVTHHVLRAYGRSVHAAMLAREFARHNRDMIPDEVYLAALLHAMGELVLWFAHPQRMRTAAALSKAFMAPTAETRYLVFGYTQQALSSELAVRWNMPPLVVEAMKPGNATEQRVLGIQLAAQFCRYYERGLERPEALRCLEHIAEVLRQSPEAARKLIEGASHGWLALGPAYGATAPETAGAAPVRQEQGADAHPTAFCIASQPLRLHEFFARFGCSFPVAADAAPMVPAGLTADALLHEATTVMHDAIGLNRVVFAAMVQDQGVLKAKYIAGADDDPIFDSFVVDLARPHLISQLMRKPAGIWINKTRWDHFGDQIPRPLSQINPAHGFFVQSLFVKGKPLGLFYADRRTPACQLDKPAFDRFQAVAALVQQGLEQILR